MKKLTNSFQCVLTGMVLVTCALLLTAVSAWAVRVDTPGVNCKAYNNNQANQLERSHVRLLNPLSSGKNIWVVCGMERDSDYNTVATENGYVFAFFQTGSIGDVTCVYRRFGGYSAHVPGGDADAANTYDAIVITATNPIAVTNQTVAVYSGATTSDATTVADIFSMTCLLPPGTGINMISWNHN